MSTYDLPPVSGRWRRVNAPGPSSAGARETGHDLSEKPSNKGGKEVSETTTMTGERAELEKSTGLPLTSLSNEEWDKVRDAATRFAAKKLHITYNEAARHYPEYIREGYMATIKGRKGAKGIPREKTPTSLAEAAELGLQDYERRMIERTKEYAARHDLSFNEAARYVV